MRLALPNNNLSLVVPLDSLLLACCSPLSLFSLPFCYLLRVWLCDQLTWRPMYRMFSCMFAATISCRRLAYARVILPTYRGELRRTEKRARKCAIMLMYQLQLHQIPGSNGNRFTLSPISISQFHLIFLCVFSFLFSMVFVLFDYNFTLTDARAPPMDSALRTKTKSN